MKQAQLWCSQPEPRLHGVAWHIGIAAHRAHAGAAARHTGFLNRMNFRILRPLSNPRARRISVTHAHAVAVKNALSIIKKITVIPMHANDVPHCIQKLHYIHIIITVEFEDADGSLLQPIFPVRCGGLPHEAPRLRARTN